MVVLLVTGGYDYAIRFWDASSGMCYKSLSHPEKQVNTLAISPDKTFLLAGSNPTLKLYDVNAKGNDALVTYDGHTGNVTSVGFQRDGRWMYSCSEDGSVRIWDPRASGSQRDYDARAAVNSVALHPNQGELIAGDHSGTVRVWDLAANKCSAELSPEGDAPISSVSVAPDASVAVAANFNGNVYAWAPRSGEGYTPLRRIAAHRAYVLSARLSPDARYLATTSSDRTVRLWATQDWSLLSTFTGHTRWVWDAAWSADSSYLVTASSDCSARLWEVGTGDTVRSYTSHHKAVTAVALNDAAPVGSTGAGAPSASSSAPGGGSNAGSSAAPTASNGVQTAQAGGGGTAGAGAGGGTGGGGGGGGGTGGGTRDA
jgi:G protein beta subunit-like protein